jgi:hypothetical protein
MPRTYALYVSFNTNAWYVCLIRILSTLMPMPYVYAVYVCLVCMPCMYALHAHHWSHGQVLPEVGDEVKMVNSRLVDGIKGVDALFTGEEGTSVEIVVEKCDNSGIFTCHLTRRPLI